MKKAIAIEDFYKTKFNWVPERLIREIGHFNVFRLEEFVGKNAKENAAGQRHPACR